MTTKRAVIYSRISVDTEESVAIEAQVAKARSYADARGWTVVAEFEDRGVSASKFAPHKRKGWGDLLAYSGSFDFVISWRLDRVARRVGDFDSAIQALATRGATFASVEEAIDLSTPAGEAMATIIAVFARLEAATTSQRVRNARQHLRTTDPARFATVGRPAPYGYQTVPNPDGKGKVLAVEPTEWPFLVDAALMVLNGGNINAACNMLDLMGAPLPTRSQGSRTGTRWSHTSLERMLRNPILSGRTPHNPGRDKDDSLRHSRNVQVLYGPDGLALVNPDLAALTVGEHRDLVNRLDHKDAPGAMPRASREATSPFLSRVAECGQCEPGQYMARGSQRGRPTLKCPVCHQTVSRTQLEGHLIDRLLTERGDFFVLEIADLSPSSFDLVEIESAIADTTNRLGDDVDEDEEIDLMARLSTLKGLRAEARGAAPVKAARVTSTTVRAAWEAATTDEERRAVLVGQLSSLRVVRGRLGRLLDPARVIVAWDPYAARMEINHTFRFGEGPGWEPGYFDTPGVFDPSTLNVASRVLGLNPPPQVDTVDEESPTIL